MNEWQEMVTAFHERFGQPVETRPEHIGWGRALQRHEWLAEEVEETRVAFADRDMEGIADGLADVIYVAIGTAVECGIDLDPIFREVHRANMQKEKAGPGEKIRKPEGWVAPDVAGELRKQGWRG